VRLVQDRAFVDQFVVRHRVPPGVGDALDTDDDGGQDAGMVAAEMS
jgi:hypothetical protein